MMFMYLIHVRTSIIRPRRGIFQDHGQQTSCFLSDTRANAKRATKVVTHNIIYLLC